MRRGVAIPAIFAALAAVQGAAVPSLFRELPGGPDALSDYRWQARPVLLFAPDADDPDYRAQIATLEAVRDGLADRDIVVLSDTRPEAGGALRARMAPAGFLLLLVGKDGGIKLRADAPVSAGTLFDTIDAMPMRRREMRAD